MRRQRWQFLAVLVTIVLGVMLFAASYDAYRNLEASYTDTYDRLAFADMTVTGADADIGTIGYEIAGFADRAGDVLTPEVREELKSLMLSRG